MRKALFGVFILLGLFLLVQTFSSFSALRYIGTGVSASNTISISGHGEALGVPNVATFTFSVVSQKLTVAEAQEEATEKINTITADLKTAGIADKDIKTIDYSVFPRYEYQQAICQGGVCPTGKQVLLGYEVRQTTSVKVHDTAEAGDLLTQVGGKGASEVSGLSFTFDDPDSVQAEARDGAIKDAKEKAEKLADSLGVNLVRVVNFSENGGGSYPAPMYNQAYSRGSAMDAEVEKAVAPTVSVGENKVTSDVTVVYEIR